MTLFWTRNALERLQGIEDHISEDAPDRAVRFVSGLMDRAESLVEFPESGRPVPEDRERLRRELIHEGYRIIYRVDDRRIYILSAFEGSRLVREDDLKS